jgi:hypothetical protein
MSRATGELAVDIAVLIYGPNKHSANQAVAELKPIYPDYRDEWLRAMVMAVVRNPAYYRPMANKDMKHRG